MYGCPHTRLCCLACPRTYEGEFPNLFPNLLRLSPNFSPNQPHLSPNFHCFHMDGNCYNEPQIAVGHFKKYFKYTLYIIISMNIVIYSSKDWPFNQILACLWSFLSISAFVSINFCNFAVKNYQTIVFT